MSRILACLLLFGLSSQVMARTEVVDSEKYRFEISIPCSDIHSSCQTVSAVMTDKQTGTFVALSGRENHTLCLDGSSCYFVGFSLSSKDVSVMIDDQAEVRFIR